MTRMPRIGDVVSLLALTVGLACWLVTPATPSLARQETDSLPAEIGAGPVRERALGLTGRNLYGPDSVEFFGYLTSVIGLDPNLLFTDAVASEQTARFTYAGSVATPSRTDRGDVTAFDGAGVLRIYLDDGGASWDDPGSFADGEPVAEWSIRLLDTLHRQAPGVGVLVGDGRLTQMTAGEFSLDGEQYRFGDEGIEQRLRYVGALMAAGFGPGELTVSLTGSANVVAREAIPVNVGGPIAAAAATPAAEVCPNLQPWLGQTVEKLTQVQSVDTVAEPNADIASLDAAAIRQQAQDVARLAETQRGIELPGSAAAANRLATTAMSTYARGLDMIATAVANQDSALLAQGQSVVADGGQLLERADEDISALADACAETS